MTSTGSAEPSAGVAAAQQHWSDALLSNNAGAIAELMHDDWVIVTPAGPIAAEPFLGAIRSGTLSHSRMQPAPTADGDALIRVYGHTAALTQRFVSTETNDGNTRDNDEWMTTVFVQTAGRWLVSLIHLTPAAESASA